MSELQTEETRSVARLLLDSGRVLWRHFFAACALWLLLVVPPTVLGEALWWLGENDDSCLTFLFLLAASIVLLAACFPGIFALTCFLVEKKASSRTRLSLSLKATIRNLVPTLATGFLIISLALLGLVLLVLPGVYLILLLFPLVPVMVIERRFGLQALKRCRDLMKGQKRRLVLLLFFMFGFAFGVVALEESGIIGRVASIGLGELLNLYLTVFCLLFYYDIRIRRSAEQAPVSSIPEAS